MKLIHFIIMIVLIFTLPAAAVIYGLCLAVRHARPRPGDVCRLEDGTHLIEGRVER